MPTFRRWAGRSHTAQSLVEYALLVAMAVLVLLVCATAYGYVLHEWLAGLLASVTSTGTLR